VVNHKAGNETDQTPADVVEENCDTITAAAREEKVSELEILQQSLEEKKRQAEDYYDQLVRLRAEFDNFRKRSEREKQNHLAWGKEEMLLKQIGLLDVLEHAANSARSSTNIESIRQGLDLIKREFAKMLTSEGVKEIESEGKKFDPAVHEAIERVASPEQEGTIIGVMQKGYMLNGRVVRPARVKVAQHEQPEAADKPAENK
jgi:molecular chaperone GrpE